MKPDSQPPIAWSQPDFADTPEADPAMEVSGPAHVAVVLHVAVEVVGNLVVHGDVVHLADRQLHAMEAASVTVVMSMPPSSVMTKRSAILGSIQMS